MNKEIWKDIINYEGIYQISNSGKVKSLLNNNLILHNNTDLKGYIYVNLYKNKKGTAFRVHRLVAIAFILNPENKPQVNHKDGVKSNNYDWNLEWNTQSENIKHAFKNGLNHISDEQKELHSKLMKGNNYGVKNKGKKYNGGLIGKYWDNSKPVNQLDLQTNKIIKTYKSATLAAKEVGLAGYSTINAVCRGKRLSSKGFGWEYAEEKRNK